MILSAIFPRHRSPDPPCVLFLHVEHLVHAGKIDEAEPGVVRRISVGAETGQDRAEQPILAVGQPRQFYVEIAAGAPGDGGSIPPKKSPRFSSTTSRTNCTRVGSGVSVNIRPPLCHSGA